MATFEKRADGTLLERETGKVWTRGEFASKYRYDGGKFVPFEAAPIVPEAYTPPADQGTLSSLGNAFVKAPVNLLGSAATIGDPQMNAFFQAEMERSLPSSGKSGFVGGALGSAVPALVAISTMGPAAAPVLGGLYGTSGASDVRGDIYQRRQQGEDISGLQEAIAAGGVGAVQGGLEAATAGILGRFLGPGQVRAGAGFLTDFGKTIATEAGQEGLEQLGSNIVSRLAYAPDRGIFDDVGMSALGGAIGGGFIHGLGRGAQFLRGREMEDVAGQQAADESFAANVYATVDEWVSIGFSKQEVMDRLVPMLGENQASLVYDEVRAARANQYATNLPESGDLEEELGYVPPPRPVVPSGDIEAEIAATFEPRTRKAKPRNPAQVDAENRKRLAEVSRERQAQVEAERRAQLEGMNNQQLKEQARQLNIQGRNRMKKAELVEAILSKQRKPREDVDLARELDVDPAEIGTLRTKGMTDDQIREELGPVSSAVAGPGGSRVNQHRPAKESDGGEPPDVEFSVLQQGQAAPLEHQEELSRVAVELGVAEQVHIYDRPGHAPDGTRIAGKVDHGDGSIHIYEGARISDIGHEATHRLARALGMDDPVVQAGLKLADGNTLQEKYENLMDAAGKVFARRNLNPTLAGRLINWIRNLWARAKQKLGLELTLNQVAEVLNSKLEDFGRRNLKAPAGVAASSPILNTGSDPMAKMAEANVEYSTLPDEDVPLRFDSVNIKRLAQTQAERRRLLRALQVLRDLRGGPRAQKSMDAERRRADKFIHENGIEGVEKLLKKAPSGNLKPWEIIALRDIVQTARIQMEDSLRNARPEDHDAIMAEFAPIFEPYGKAANQAGLRLRAFKEAGQMKEWSELFSQYQLTPEMAEKIQSLDLSKYRDVIKLVRMLQKPTTGDLWRTVYLNSLLANPKTWIQNFGINTAILGAVVPERYAAGAIDWMLSKGAAMVGSKRERRIYASEMKRMLQAMPKGVNVGWDHVRQVVKSGVLPEEIAMAYDMHTVLLDAFARHDNPNVREIGKYVAWPVKILGATDAMHKAVAWTMEARAQAERVGRNEGLSGPELEARVNDLFDKVTRHQLEDPIVEAITMAAGRSASKWTFTERAKPGSITRGITDLRDSIPAAWAVMPFINTLSNIIKIGVQHTPGVGLAYNYRGMQRDAILNNPDADAHAKQMATKGDTISLPEALAQQLMGAIAAFLFMQWFGDEDKTVGALPDDPDEVRAFLASGKRPFSTKFGNHWVSWNQLDPFAMPLRLMVAARDYYKDPDNFKDDPGFLDKFYDLSWALGSTFGDNTYLNVLGESTNEHAMQSRLARIPASFVPLSNLFRGIRFTLNNMQEGGRKIPEKNSFEDRLVNEIANVIPLPNLTPDILQRPKRLDVWGEEIVVPGNVFTSWLPVQISPERLDPVDKELWDLDYAPGLPQRTLQFQNREYDVPEDLWREHAMVYGKARKEIFEKVIGSERYQNIEDPIRKLLYLHKVSDKATIRPRLLLLRKMKDRGLLGAGQ